MQQTNALPRPFNRAILLLALLLCSLTAFAQGGKKVTGVVNDETGQPVVGANVVEEGTTNGIITDADGRFALTVKGNNAVLSISYIGFSSQKIPVRGKNHLTVTLKEDSEALSEVVVVAYGQQRKEAITGAVSNVKADAIERRPVANATAALEGQALGVQVNNSLAYPGSTPTIRIRGFNSVNGSNDPLYVVNGVPFTGSINDINPADIESISVLKDASSAALYGNKAANGVILITTKTGHSGNTEVSAEITQGVYQRGIPEYKRLNASQFMEAIWMAQRNALYTDDSKGNYSTWNDANADATAAIPGILGENYDIFNKGWGQLFDENGKLVAGTSVLPGYKNDMDWYKPLERSGYRSNYNLSARGGTDKTSYYMSVGYLKENNFIKYSDGERLTASSRVEVTPTKWFKTGLNLNGSHQVYNMFNGSPDNASNYSNPFYFARTMSPVYPVHLHDPATGDYLLDSDGNKQFDPGTGRMQNNNRNVIWESMLNKDKSYRNALDGTLYADVMVKDFTLSLKGNMMNRNTSEKTYDNAIIGDGAGKGRMAQIEYRYKSYLFQELLNWKHTFNVKHNVEALIGHENYSYNYQYTYLYKQDEKLPNLMELSNFSTMSSEDGYQNGYKTEGYFARVGYNYAQKYFGEASFRRDGSSRFYKDNRWGNFWSLGGSWMLSEESFIRQYDWINYLKLRAAYGEVGQDAGVGYYGWMPLYSSEQNGGLGAYFKSNNAARDISWETSQSFSVALEANLFKRWNFSIEYFDKTSKNLLFDVKLPGSMGATDFGSSAGTSPTQTMNFGSVANRGFEIATDYDIVKNKNWKWNVGIELNTLSNKILKLPAAYGDEGYVNGTKKWMVGHSIYDFWLYQYQGVDRSNGRALYAFDNKDYYVKESGEEANGRTLVEANAGNYTIINGKTYSCLTTYAQKGWSGTSIPDVYGSFNTSLSYKDFQLSVLFTYQLGGKALDYSYNSLMSVGSSPGAIATDALKSWTPSEAGSGIDPHGTPALNFSQSSYNNAISSRFLVSTDYLNIKNVTLSYQVPKSLTNKIGLKSLLVSASADNIWLFTARQGMNPQQSFNGIIDNGYVPARIMTLGLNVKF
jgi:TonB-linked SusC/RagA family outer membrane protein